MIEVSTSGVVEARERLRAGHGALAEAQGVLEAAKAAAERARAFAINARDRCTAVEEESRDIAIDRSISIRNAILAGETPTFESSPTLTANALAQKELEHRAAAAEIAQADLEAQAGEAMRAATQAQDAVRAAAQGVALAEANALAEQVLGLEAQALALRAFLGGSLSPVGQFPQMTEALKRVIVSTDDLGDVFLRRGDLWNASKAAATVWRDYVAELEVYPDARLNFDAPVAEEAQAA